MQQQAVDADLWLLCIKLIPATSGLAKKDPKFTPLLLRQKGKDYSNDSLLVVELAATNYL